MTEIRRSANEGRAADRQRYLRILRAKVVMAGLRINDVGRETGYHPSLVTHVLAGRRNNQKIVEFIERLA